MLLRRRRAGGLGKMRCCYYESSVKPPRGLKKLLNGMKPKLTQILFKFYKNVFNHKKLKICVKNSFQPICWESRKLMPVIQFLNIRQVNWFENYHARAV